MKLADQWLKFRAALSDRRARLRVSPKNPGEILKLYLDLELELKKRGDYGGQRAVFITELARFEDELYLLRLDSLRRQEADAAMRREEASRTANRRHEAVAETKRKLKVDTQHGCNN